MQLIIDSESELNKAAKEIINYSGEQTIWAFYGEMGAGKTTFIKVLCEKLNVVDVVSSPTFAIVNVYRTKNNTQVNHFDCYRMKSIEEAFDIGYEDYFFSGDYCFIEWPEKIESLLPEGTVRVKFEISSSGNSRIISF